MHPFTGKKVEHLKLGVPVEDFGSRIFRANYVSLLTGLLTINFRAPYFCGQILLIISAQSLWRDQPQHACSLLTVEILRGFENHQSTAVLLGHSTDKLTQ